MVKFFQFLSGFQEELVTEIKEILAEHFQFLSGFQTLTLEAVYWADVTFNSFPDSRRLLLLSL